MSYDNVLPLEETHCPYFIELKYNFKAKHYLADTSEVLLSHEQKSKSF